MSAVVLLDPALGTTRFSLSTRRPGKNWAEVIISNDCTLVLDAAISAMNNGVEVVMVELDSTELDSAELDGGSAGQTPTEIQMSLNRLRNEELFDESQFSAEQNGTETP